MLSGDFSSLDSLARNAARLADVPAEVSADAARGIQELIDQEFEDGKDPYGTAWTPLAEATLADGRFPPPLTDTHAMRDSLNVYARGDGRGVALSLDHPAMPHQTGWTGKQGSGPARPIFPAHDYLPGPWEEVIESAADRSIAKAMR